MATFFNRRGRPAHPDILTPSEWRVLELVREGKTNAEIAYELAISVPGVKYHITNMLGKLQVDDRAGLAAWRPETEPQSDRRPSRRALAPAIPWAFKSVAVTSVGTVAVSATAAGIWALRGGGDSNTSPTASQAVVSPTPTVRDITHLVQPFVDTGHGWRYAIGRVTATDEWVTIIYHVQGDYEGLRPAHWPPGARNADGLPSLHFSLEDVQASVHIPEGSSSVGVAFSPAIRDTASGSILEDGDWVLIIPLH